MEVAIKSIIRLSLNIAGFSLIFSATSPTSPTLTISTILGVIAGGILIAVAQHIRSDN